MTPFCEFWNSVLQEVEKQRSSVAHYKQFGRKQKARCRHPGQYFLSTRSEKTINFGAGESWRGSHESRPVLRLRHQTYFLLVHSS